MSAVRRGGYGELVGTAFVVVVSFHLLMGLIGVAGALAAPAFFNLNGRPAENQGEALLALGVLFVAVLLIDALACAVGAAVWMVLRIPFRGRAGS